MAFTSTTIQPVTKNDTHPVLGNEAAASLLLGILLAAYAAKNSKKALRKAKRKLVLATLKMKFLKKANDTTTNTVIWVLLAIAIILLLILAPIAALVLAIIGLILYLTGTIHF